MKSERILYALTGVRDDFVEQAEPGRVKPARAWVKYMAAAACLCIVIAGVLALGQRESKLPLIDMPELGIGGMGFEGYMYYDASEIENGNPWREDMVFETMPVFKNGAYYDPTAGLGWPHGLDEAEVLRRLTAAAKAMGLEILETEYYLLSDMAPEAYPDEIYRIEALTECGEIYAYTDGMIGWDFDVGSSDGIELPEGYSMTSYDTTTEQALKTMEYLTQTYAEILDFDEPAYIVSGAYNIYGQYHREYDAYDASGDDLQDILNYAYGRVSFGCNEKGELFCFWLYDDFAVLDKIGDYPIIGIDEARERLLAGLYQTSVPYDMPGEEYIAKVELMYRRSPYEEVFLPYYRFYVELPEDGFAGEELGLKTFGAYYVPAIESRYIGNAETYHGQFN